LIKQAAELDQTLRWAAQPRFRVEAVLLQMVRMENAVQLQDLLQQIDGLKKKLNDGRSASSVPAVTPGSPPESSVRVAGEVNAGYLKSSAAVRYSNLTPPPVLANGNGGVRSEPAPKQPASILAFSPPAPETPSIQADVHGRWNDFVGDILKKKIALGTTLREVHLLDARNGMLRISCPDDFHHATLRRHKEFLSDAFEQFFGSRISFEPVMQKDVEPAANAGPTPRAAQEPGNGNGEHPLISVLKREFDAEKMRE
jgi:hypothetical protein